MSTINFVQDLAKLGIKAESTRGCRGGSSDHDAIRQGA
jgi:hypothetical protein